MRIFEAIKDKAQSEKTYKEVISSLDPLIKELQLTLPEEMGF